MNQPPGPLLAKHPWQEGGEGGPGPCAWRQLLGGGCESASLGQKPELHISTQFPFPDIPQNVWRRGLAC